MNDSIYVITHQTSASSNGKNRREGCENLRQSIYSLCHYAFIHYICHYAFHMVRVCLRLGGWVKASLAGFWLGSGFI